MATPTGDEMAVDLINLIRNARYPDGLVLSHAARAELDRYVDWIRAGNRTEIGNRLAEIAGPPPTQVSITIWDPDWDGPVVRHDGEQVWAETTMGSFGQYLRHHAPLGRPVVLTLQEDA